MSACLIEKIYGQQILEKMHLERESENCSEEKNKKVLIARINHCTRRNNKVSLNS